MHNVVNDKWQVIKLVDICTTTQGKLFPGNIGYQYRKPLSYINPRNLLYNEVPEGSSWILKDKVPKHGSNLVPKHSLIISTSGLLAGSMALVSTEAVLPNEIISITFRNRRVHEKFLYYYLIFKKNDVIRVSRYNTKLSYRYLQRLDIPVPVFTEQHKIIKQLDTELKKLRLSVKGIKQELAKLNQREQRLLSRFFCNPETKRNRDSTKVLSCADFCTISIGKTPNSTIKKYFGNACPLFKPGDIKGKMMLVEAETNLSLSGLTVARLVEAQSVIFCASGKYFGEAAIASVDCACNQQIISLSPVKNVIPAFLYYQLRSKFFKDQLRQSANNNAISKCDFEALSLIVPGLAKQKKVVRLFQKLWDARCDLENKLSGTDALQARVLSDVFSTETNSAPVN